MDLPTGKIVHLTSGRARIRIEQKKNDPAFFKSLEENLKGIAGVKAIHPNPLTGSLLIEGDFSDAGQLAELLNTDKLFQLTIPQADGTPVRQKVYHSFTVSNRFVKNRSRGNLTCRF